MYRVVPLLSVYLREPPGSYVIPPQSENSYFTAKCRVTNKLICLLGLFLLLVLIKIDHVLIGGISVENADPTIRIIHG